MAINKLTTADKLSLGDFVALGSTNNGEDRKASLNLLVEFMKENLSLDDKKDSLTTQYSSPNTDGFTVTVNDGLDSDLNAWLILTPAAAYATMTITLPPYAEVSDKQEVLINSTQAVSALTIGLNGATAVIGNPTDLSANDSFKLKYDKPFKTWYKVG